MNWIESSPSGGVSARFLHALAYDTARGRTVLFGGHEWGSSSGTWEYGLTHAASLAPFGNGCAGSAGTPTLASLAGQAPWLGENLPVVLSRLPASAPALLLVGRSRTSWGAIALPAPLDALGMTGCTLFASAEVLIATASSAGVANVTIPIPNDASLLGASFFSQGLVADPPANAAATTASNAAEGKIGGK
jgi:hypothetical protein